MGGEAARASIGGEAARASNGARREGSEQTVRDEATTARAKPRELRTGAKQREEATRSGGGSNEVWGRVSGERGDDGAYFDHEQGVHGGEGSQPRAVGDVAGE